MTTSGIAGFRKKLVDDPDDFTTRLVMADWLDEQGRAQAAALQRVLAEPKSPDHRRNYAALIEEAEPLRGRVVLELADLGENRYVHEEGMPAFVAVGSDEPGLPWCATVFEGVPGVRLVSSRGFVVEAHGPLSLLIGGACPACHGDRRLIGDPACETCRGRGRVADPDSEYRDGVMDCPDCDSIDCGRCDGAGKVEGCLKKIVSSHPVERVAVTDRATTKQDDKFWFMRSANFARPDTVPKYLMRRMRGCPMGKNCDWIGYDTHEEAMADLCRVVLARAKREAAMALA